MGTSRSPGPRLLDVPAPDVDLLGRQRTAAPVDWPEAEEAFETLGMR